MERNLFVVGIISLLIAGLTFPVQAQQDGGAPNQNDMINQRLRSDIADLRKENQRLKRQLQRGESGQTGGNTGSSSELREENRELRQLLEQYGEIVQQLVDLMEKANSVLEKSGEASSQQVSRPDDTDLEESKEWIREEDRPYPIRREPLQEEITYTTGPNDTLSKLAHQFYHDAELWIRIYLVNEDRLNSPDNLPPGTTLRLPPVDRIRQ